MRLRRTKAVLAARAQRPGAVREASKRDKREELVTVTLACGHTNDYPEPAPPPGGYAYCHRCRKTVRSVVALGL